MQERDEAMNKALMSESSRSAQGDEPSNDIPCTSSEIASDSRSAELEDLRLQMSRLQDEHAEEISKLKSQVHAKEIEAENLKNR